MDALNSAFPVLHRSSIDSTLGAQVCRTPNGHYKRRAVEHIRRGRVWHCHQFDPPVRARTNDHWHSKRVLVVCVHLTWVCCSVLSNLQNMLACQDPCVHSVLFAAPGSGCVGAMLNCH